MFLGCFSTLTWNYLGVWWYVIFNIYTFLSPYKLCTVFLFRCFFSKSICFNEYQSFILTFVPYYCDCLWKYMHWHVNISFNTAKFNFSLTVLFLKNKIFMTNTFLVLNYLAPVSFRYNYLFLYYLFFIYLEASIGVLEKRLFQFWSPIQ